MSSPYPSPLVPETWRTRLSRWYINLFPAFRGSGARVTHVSGDWSEIRVRLPLSWRNRNLVGTIFGGSLYASVDPFYMIQLMKRLGPDYIVWDKSAAIHFRQPGRTTLHARFLMPLEEVERVRVILRDERSVDLDYRCEIVDAQGELHAAVDKCVYVKRKPQKES